MNYRLHYTSYLAVLEGYIDVNWIFDTKHLKSTSEYNFRLGGAVVHENPPNKYVSLDSR
jgi:hypothetical protein